MNVLELLTLSAPVANGEAAAQLWEYATAFVLAATPWLELLLVIPAGLAWGLPPVPLAVVVLAGNTSTVLPVVWLHDWWRRSRLYRRLRVWRGRRRAAKGKREDEPSRLAARAMRVWKRYGLPGLALLAPLVTGVHLATAIALLSGAPRRAVLFWMVGSMVIWTIGVTIVSYYGIEGLRWVFR